MGEREETRGRPLTVVTRCESLVDLVSLYGSYYDGDALFLLTPRLREVGTRQRVTLTLADRTPVLAGEAVVTASLPDARSPYGKAGMRLEFVKQDRACREAFDLLAQEAAVAQVMPTTRIDKLNPSDGLFGSFDEVVSSRLMQMLAASRRVTQEISAQELTGTTPASAAAPLADLDPELEALLECEIFEDPLDDLDRASSGSRERPAPPVTPQPAQHSRWLLVAAVVGLVGCIALAAGLLR